MICVFDGGEHNQRAAEMGSSRVPDDHACLVVRAFSYISAVVARSSPVAPARARLNRQLG
jgi:hypothetical protein